MPRRLRNPNNPHNNSDGRNNPWELEELRAEVNGMFGALPILRILTHFCSSEK